MGQLRKEYRVLSEKYIEHLMKELNAHGDEGWSVVLYVQEFGVTKVLLEREINNTQIEEKVVN